MDIGQKETVEVKKMEIEGTPGNKIQLCDQDK